LQIQVEFAFGFNHGMTAGDADLRSASAFFTGFGHKCKIVLL